MDNWSLSTATPNGFKHHDYRPGTAHVGRDLKVNMVGSKYPQLISSAQLSKNRQARLDGAGSV